MFDIGFWELMILGLVALLVVGPERLPKLAYTAGKWLSKGRRMLSSVKEEIDKEIKNEELKDVLEKQKREMASLEEVIEETTDSVQGVVKETEEAVRDAQQTLSGSEEPGTATAEEAAEASDRANDDRERPRD